MIKHFSICFLLIITALSLSFGKVFAGFTDVPTSAWFSPFVEKMQNLGIISGYRNADGSLTGMFGPGDTVTNGQVFKILSGVMDITPISITNHHWAYGYLLAVSNEVSPLTMAEGDLDLPASRELVVILIAQLLKLPQQPSPFPDTQNLEIGAVAAVGIVSGYGDGRFGPDNSLLRAEMAKIASKVLEYKIANEDLPLSTKPKLPNATQPPMIPPLLPEPPLLADLQIDFTGLPVTTISACQEIQTSGRYIVDRNLVRTENKPCIEIHDVQDVALDCQGSSITSAMQIYEPVLSVKDVTRFTVENCTLALTSDISFFTVMSLNNSSQGIIKNNVIGAENKLNIINGENVSFIQLLQNQVLGSYELSVSHHNKISNNGFYPSANSKGACVVNLSGGSNNEVLNNSIDGRSDGVFNFQYDQNIGFDDGICFGYESFDRIEGNTVLNHWDCAIETLGDVSDSLIRGNRLVNNGVCGIGGWHHNHWRNNTVAKNVVENSPSLFTFFQAAAPPDLDAVYFFEENQFIDNRLIGFRAGAPGVPSQGFGFGFGQDTAIRLNLNNNLIMNNDFGDTNSPVLFLPGSAFIDGGDNRCSTETSSFDDYPIACQL
ncbi:MAG: S-layer homology domain-containing protein [Candidatus Altimarinota bacterium]